MTKLIDSFDELKCILNTVTFAQLRHKYGTSRAFTLVTSCEKKSLYRHGVMTEIGDIKESVWMQAMEYIIKREGETELYENLRAWVTDTCVGWFKTDKELTKYALELHSVRIFDNREWVGFIEFNKKFRPEFIED